MESNARRQLRPRSLSKCGLSCLRRYQGEAVEALQYLAQKTRASCFDQREVNPELATTEQPSAIELINSFALNKHRLLG